MYCHNCGEKINLDTDKFCSKCGTPFYSSKPRRANISKGIFIGFTIILFGIFSPFIFKWLFGNCGVVPVSRAITDLDGFANDLKQLEDATINNKKPPSYLLAKIDGNISTIVTSKDDCTAIAYTSMNNALVRASRYFGELPPFEMTDAKLAESYNGYVIQLKQEYESALRNYFSDVGKLKSCHPFCNIDTLFDIGKASEYP